MDRISVSPTLRIDARATQLIGEGKDIVKLNVGEPDCPTFEYIRRAGIRALESGFTRYTPVNGIPELRGAIAEKLRTENGIGCSPDEVTVTVGGKQAVSAAVTALVGEGDEVVIPTPCWVSYADMVRLAGGVPVFVPAREENEYAPDIEAVERAVTARTRAMILCSPNNPTGAVYPVEILRALGELACKHDCYIIMDEIYEKLVYDGAKHVSMASLSPEIARRTVTVNGFSKAYAMTGWRIGWAAGPRETVKAIQAIQSQTTSNTNSIAQYAALEALTGPQDDVAQMVMRYAERRDYVCARLAAMPGLRLAKPRGAFYVFPDVTALLGRRAGERRINSAVELAEYLLCEALVAVVPGEAFEKPGSIRISYSNSMENLAKAMDRMERAISALSTAAMPEEKEGSTA